MLCKARHIGRRVCGGRRDTVDAESLHILDGQEVVIGDAIRWHFADPAQPLVDTDLSEEIPFQPYQSLNLVTHVVNCRATVLTVAFHPQAYIIVPQAGMLQVMIVTMPGDHGTLAYGLVPCCREHIVGAGRQAIAVDLETEPLLEHPLTQRDCCPDLAAAGSDDQAFDTMLCNCGEKLPITRLVYRPGVVGRFHCQITTGVDVGSGAAECGECQQDDVTQGNSCGIDDSELEFQGQFTECTVFAP